VFLTEGMLKFVHPDELGAGRFAAIGLPLPHLLAPLVGSIEIVAGSAIVLNFFAGEAALALLLVIVTALISTKLPILLGGPSARLRWPKRLTMVAGFSARGAH